MAKGILNIMKRKKRMKKNSPVLGIGNDIIEISRIEASIEKHGQKFLDRIFTPKELAFAAQFENPISFYAGRFCGKEAIVKALGVGFGAEASWQDIEILNDERGKPIVHLSGAIKEHFNHPELLLSISHCKQYATAVAIWIQ